MPETKDTDIVDETAAVVERLRAAYTSWNNPPSDGLPDGAGVVLEAADLLERLSRERGTVQEGWVLVPKEPTPEMARCLEENFAECLPASPVHVANWRDAYRAMLSAAPQPPIADDQVPRPAITGSAAFLMEIAAQKAELALLIAEALRTVRRETLEEAARVAETFHPDDDRMDRQIKIHVAQAIRSLAKAKEPVA